MDNACLAGLLMYLCSLDFIRIWAEKFAAQISERIEMNKRKLGNSGLEISPLVFGGNVFGWTVDEPTSFNLLDAFVAAGFNAIDTADSLFQVGARPHGRGIGDDSRQVDEAQRKPGQSHHRDESGLGTGAGTKGIVAIAISCARRKIPCAACKPITSICTSRTSMIRTRRRRKLCEPMRN